MATYLSIPGVFLISVWQVLALLILASSGVGTINLFPGWPTSTIGHATLRISQFYVEEL
jgi:hypothetical protein